MRWFVVFLILNLHNPVWAEGLIEPTKAEDSEGPDPPIETVPPGNDQIVSVRKGDIAPLTGQLFDMATALRWTNWLTQYRVRLVQDVNKEREICSVEAAFQKTLHQTETMRAEVIEKDLRDRILKLEQRNFKLVETANKPPAFYSTFEFGVLLGVVSSTILVVVIGTAAKK